MLTQLKKWPVFVMLIIMTHTQLLWLHLCAWNYLIYSGRWIHTKMDIFPLLISANQVPTRERFHSNRNWGQIRIEYAARRFAGTSKWRAWAEWKNLEFMIIYPRKCRLGVTHDEYKRTTILFLEYWKKWSICYDAFYKTLFSWPAYLFRWYFRRLFVG